MFNKTIQDLVEKSSLNNIRKNIEASITNAFSPLMENSKIPQIKNLEAFRSAFEPIWKVTGTKFVDDIITSISIPSFSPETIGKLSSLGNIDSWVIVKKGIEKIPDHWLAKDKVNIDEENINVPPITYEQIFKHSLSLVVNEPILPDTFIELDEHDFSFDDLLNVANNEYIITSPVHSRLYPLTNELIYAISYYTQCIYIYGKIVKELSKKPSINHVSSIFSFEETNSYKITPQVSKCPPPTLLFA